MQRLIFHSIKKCTGNMFYVGDENWTNLIFIEYFGRKCIERNEKCIFNKSPNSKSSKGYDAKYRIWRSGKS